MGVMEQILVQLQEMNQKFDNLEIGDSQQKVFDAEEAAEYLKISKDKMYKLMRNNEIEFVKIGNRQVVTLDQLNKFINDNSVDREIKEDRFKNNIKFLSNTD